MSKWKCEICGKEFDNFHAQGFDNKIYCPLCYFKKENQELKLELSGYRQAILEDKDMLGLKEEIRRLKKQLESANEQISCLRRSIERKEERIIDLQYERIPYTNEYVDKLLNQQKEFISYLENKIYSIEPKGTGINYNCEYDSEEDYISAMKEQSKLNTLKEILSKFKSIIGSDINVGSIGEKDE